MEVGDKLKDLNMTVDEIDRLTQAFKDEKFREMFRDYAQELSDPENKKRYEEEIKLLEQERGNTIEFIHPEPFRALRTSENGKNKCFINICTNAKVGKPECKWGTSEVGRRGQCWSLPHSLHPGRQDTDPKGNRIVIYDVIFHPDTLHIASKNQRFMDMVDSTAMEGIQKTFKVTLDKNNTREISTKYKGTPQPCVIRKPIPGFQTKEPSEKLADPLAFPYPNNSKRTTASSSQSKPKESKQKTNQDSAPESLRIQPQEETKEPTQPRHTVKYRSFIDLQDFRDSRDSAQSPRPKEIVVTIDLPLLKAVTGANLEVTERRLLLESKTPDYRLELPLAYPVDQDKGEAKFNKQRGQLTVTLPVLPSNEAFDYDFAPTGEGDGVTQKGDREVDKKETDGEKSEEEGQGGVYENDLKQQMTVEKGGEEEEGEDHGMEGEEDAVGAEKLVDAGQEEWRKQKRKGGNSDGEEEEISSEEEKVKRQEQGDEKEVGRLNLCGDAGISAHDKLSEDGCDGAEETNDIDATGFKRDTVFDQCLESFAVSRGASPQQGNQPPVLIIAAEHESCEVKEGEVKLESGVESPTEMKTSEISKELENVEPGSAFLHDGSNEEYQAASAAAVSSILSNTSPETEERGGTTATEKVDGTSGGGSDNGVPVCSEELAPCSLEWERGVKPPPVLLREVDEDGNETVISSHTTTAGFVFQNSLMFELD